MRFRALTAAAAVTALVSATPLHAQQFGAPRPAPTVSIKTRLDLFSGTDFVLVLSYIPAEITSVTCEKWTMLGINSWKGHNNFTIPAGPAVAVMNSDGFDGYCSKPGSIVAHTDIGDFVGKLDRGDGAWSASTKLTFAYQPQQ